MRTFKRFVIITMLASFLASAATSLVKFPELKKYFLFAYNYAPASKISMIHDWSGIVLIVSIILHLILKRRGLLEAFSGDYQIPKNISRAIYVLIGVVLAGLAVYYFKGLPPLIRKPIDLSSVEVRDYKGEKLDSINDFR